jgi:hypothetical protein
MLALLAAALLIVAPTAHSRSRVAAASGYDRQPVRLDHAQADGAGQTISNAEESVRHRYPTAKTIRCTGAIVIGQESTSSWMSGTARYWDKLWCAVGTSSRTNGVSFVFDPKGKTGAFVIYRLKPWTGTAAPPAGSTPNSTNSAPPTATSSPTRTYKYDRSALRSYCQSVVDGLNDDPDATGYWSLDSTTYSYDHATCFISNEDDDGSVFRVSDTFYFTTNCSGYYVIHVIGGSVSDRRGNFQAIC